MSLLRSLADMASLIDDGLHQMCTARRALLLSKETERRLDKRFQEARDEMIMLTAELHRAARSYESGGECQPPEDIDGRREGQDG
jgi:hypothetical protein